MQLVFPTVSFACIDRRCTTQAAQARNARSKSVSFFFLLVCECLAKRDTWHTVYYYITLDITHANVTLELKHVKVLRYNGLLEK